MAYVRPTNHEENVEVYEPEKAYDVDSNPPVTNAGLTIIRGETSSEFVMTFPAIISDLAKFFLGVSAGMGIAGYVWVRVYNDSWHQVYEGALPSYPGSWVETGSYNYSNVTKIGVTIQNSSTEGDDADYYIFDVQLNEVAGGLSIPVAAHHYKQMQEA